MPMASNRNWVTINPHESNPRSGIRGKFAIVTGVLKGLFHSGFRYLSQIAEKFTEANITKVPKFVISATNLMLLSRTKEADKTITARMATQGVPLPESFERLRGKEPLLWESYWTIRRS